MDFSDIVQPGMSREDMFEVEEAHTAMHLGSGASRVLATPWMIAFMERTCHRLLAGLLPAGYSSVGILVNIRHLAACSVGSRIKVIGEIESVNGLKVMFNVSAWNGETLIGKGQHERYIIDEQRFLSKLNNQK
ncbi:MAG: thioesterase family protein [Chloroflexota bacterium]